MRRHPNRTIADRQRPLETARPPARTAHVHAIASEQHVHTPVYFPADFVGSAREGATSPEVGLSHKSPVTAIAAAVAGNRG